MQPIEIQVQKAQKTVRIQWENGEEKRYSFSALRTHCPCADCRVERERNARGGQLQIPLRMNDWTDLDRVELVGNYALRIYWKDGHQHGIYSWDVLYGIPSKPSEEKES
ncbi:MAG: DUF971 domain-containing protein [Anaerolineales bacterium]|nr:DUF971 domain-containing protein [Anaerolineales bacterium]